MKVLVAIAYYGTANASYVRRIIDEYASMRFDVDVVVLSEAPKDLDGVELRIGLPSPNPYSLPFAHKQLFVERSNEYDLFVYSEDDTLITERAIDSFMWATERLPEHAIAGFLRSEQGADGARRCSSVSGCFHWRPESAIVVGSDVFAEFTNPHAASFMMTRSQLGLAIASGGFDAPPREGRLDMRVTAATDPYTVCGFTKVVCVTRLDDFLLPHLTNRYVDTELGLSLDEFSAQADAVRRAANGDIGRARLFEPTVSLDDARWDKVFYEPVDRAAISSLPKGVSVVVSVGSGSGTLESPLVEDGIDVIGIPLDEIIAVSAHRRGLRTIDADIDRAAREVESDSVGAILAAQSLHHFPDPVNVLRELRAATSPDVPIVATFPNVPRETLRWALGRARRPPRRAVAAAAGVHLGGARSYSGWFQRAGYTGIVVSWTDEQSVRRPVAARLTAPTVQVVATGRTVRSPRRRLRRPRPLVSVGLPVFNGENYVERALESIIAQDMDDFELVICDNASTDRTEQICRDLAGADGRVRYVRQEQNIGAARNYNDCFHRSSGQFFTWLAHDDLRGSGFLTKCLDGFAAEGSPVLVYPRAEFIDEAGESRARDDYGVDCRSPRAWSRFAVAVADTGPVNPIFGLIRASALEQTRLIGSFVASDRVLLAELALLGEIHEIPDVLSFRRLHAQMSTNANPGKQERTRWFDPNARPSRLNEPQLLAREYGRSVMNLPLDPLERVASMAMIPARMGGRYGRIALGRWRRQLFPAGR